MPVSDGARVLIDVTAVPANRAGVGRYVDELVRALPTPVVIACQARDVAHYLKLAPLATVLPQSGIEGTAARFAWEQFVLPGVARRAGVRVIHSPHYTLPLFTRRRRVVTFHDATFFSAPGVHTRVKRVFFRNWMRLSGRLAAAVIVPSHATASELQKYIRPRAYAVIYHGVDTSVFKPPTDAEIATLRSTFDLPAEWIAFLGTIEPRKNLPELLKAYAALASAALANTALASKGKVPPLVLAGSPGWGPAIDDAIAAVPPPGVVKTLGYIDLALLPAFLGGAVMVAYPSLGEGFGLPVLEGMASGATVLTTPRLAIPEVGGDAVAYTEPDAASIETALAALIADPAERARLAALAIERAATFTWARTAAEHEVVYANA